MKLSRHIMAAFLGLTLIALALVAAPPVQGQTNILQNPGFEGGTRLVNFSNVPNSWDSWWTNAGGQGDAQFGLTYDPRRIKEGSSAVEMYQHYYNIDGGLYQVVPNVQANAIYRFQIWGHYWSESKPEAELTGDSDTDASMRIGIDPTGGTDPFSGNIVWSGWANTKDAHSLYTIEATAQGGTITVFVEGKTTWPVTKNYFFWDDGSLVMTGTDTAQPTATPASGGNTGGSGGSSGVPIGSIPKSTPAADGSVTHIVAAGETLTGIALTYDVTIEHIKQLNGLTSNLIKVGQKLLIQPSGGQAPSEPTEEVADTGDQGTEEESPPPAEDVEDTTQTGQACILTFNDVNANGIREPAEQPLSGITFEVNDGTSTVGTYTTTDANPSYCFPNLTPGQYIISWTGTGFAPTNDNTWVADVQSGTSPSHEFGATSDEDALQDDQGSAQRGDGDGLPLWLIIVIFALGGILLLGGLGTAVYFFLIRRNADIE